MVGLPAYGAERFPGIGVFFRKVETVATGPAGVFRQDNPVLYRHFPGMHGNRLLLAGRGADSAPGAGRRYQMITGWFLLISGLH